MHDDVVRCYSCRHDVDDRDDRDERARCLSTRCGCGWEAAELEAWQG